MNNQDYRKGRVRVTEQIKGTLISLVEQEKDFEKKKKHPAIWYRDEVAQALKLTENKNPSLRSYEEALKRIRKRFQVENPLDNPWSIGSCIEYDIPADIIPMLIEYRRLISNINTPQGKRDLSKTRLTIRKARWMARLYPAVSPLVEKQYPNEPSKQMVLRSSIADEYARRERLSEILEQPLAETHILDTLLFIREDLPPDDAILSALLMNFTPDEFTNLQKLLKLADNVDLPDRLFENVKKRTVKNERSHTSEE